MPTVVYRTVDLAARLGGTARGPDTTVNELADADHAAVGCLVVAADAAAAERALQRGASALVVARGEAEAALGAVIEVDDARLALAVLTALFDRRPEPAAGVHPRAVVADDARLADDVALGANTVIESGAQVGRGSRIGPNCTVGRGVRLGRDCRLHAGVVLYDGVELGDRVTLHSGCVIGADGFGYAAGPTGAVKIHHLGGVVVGDDVEIGANTAVDRGTLAPTRIGDRTKIDNHCQVGHNVRIGSDCLIAAMAALAGSTTIGDRTVIAGDVAVADHVTIGAGATIAGRSGVTKDVPAGETWAGFPAQPYRRWVRGLYLLGRLERMWETVKGLDAGR